MQHSDSWMLRRIVEVLASTTSLLGLQIVFQAFFWNEGDVFFPQTLDAALSIEDAWNDVLCCISCQAQIDDFADMVNGQCAS